jgi:protein-S-isoprenylcysteine O-methyltransferase Ste14
LPAGQYGDVIFVIVVGVAWAVLTAVLLYRLLRDYTSGRVSNPTAFLLWPWHLLNYVVLIAVAAAGVWAFDLPAVIALGAVLTALGLGVVGAGFYEFSTVQRLSGTQTDEVIDSGIYRFSRHPQYLGLILTLIGVALIGESLAALGFALALSLGFVLYLPTEERYAERSLGDGYRAYRERTPMLVGRPR